MDDIENTPGRVLVPHGARAQVDISADTARLLGTPHTLAHHGVPADDDDLRTRLLHCRRVASERRWLIVLVTVSLLAIGLTATLLQTPLYTASTRIQIDRQAARILDTGSVAPAEVADHEALRTQFEVLRSRSLAERVAASIGAADDADFLAPRHVSLSSRLVSWLPGALQEQAAPDTAARTGLAADIIAENVVISPVPGSRLLDIVYTDPSPTRAATIANDYADAYIAHDTDRRRRATAYARTFLDEQARQLQVRLQDSETALLHFSEEQQIIILSEKSTIAESNLAAANASLAALVAERIRAEQVWRQVEAQTSHDLPQFLSNTAIQDLRAERKALETEYQEKLQTFKPSYPAMIEISRKLKEIDRQHTAELGSIRASLKGAYEAARRQEDETRAGIETLRGEVLALQKQLIRYNILKREVESNRTLHDDVLRRLKAVEVAGGSDASHVFVLDKAIPPRSPSSPQTIRAVLLWLALGLGAGCGAAFLLDRLDDTVRSPDDLEHATGLPVLGVIPRVDDYDIPIELADTGSRLSEAYRSFCSSLQLPSGGGGTLLFTSAAPAEGKSITALTIARNVAARGRKVLLIDADLRAPSLHTRLHLRSTVGLSSYLAGTCPALDAIQATDLATLAFLASGPPPDNAADLLASPRLGALLSASRGVFDLVVVDGPPVMELADAPLLAGVASATVLLVAAGEAKAAAVRDAQRRLVLSRATLIGTVLTKHNTRRASHTYAADDGGGNNTRLPPPLTRIA
jgi:capsular exopolysaccharide synthesis family protein